MSSNKNPVKLLVDVEKECIQLGVLTLQGQWVDFYAVLAVSRLDPATRDEFVGADAVARVGPWRHKTVASVGKEVARHIARLAEKKLAEVVRHEGRTRSWRLDMPAAALRLHPSHATVRDWLRARTMGAAREDGWLASLGALVASTVSLQRGDAEAALIALNALPKGVGAAEPALEAWSALLEGRAAMQHYDDDDEVLSRLHDTWSQRVDAPGRAVAARLRTFLTLRYRFNDAAATLADLGKLAAELELRGDVGSLAAVVNVMGLLARRAGNPEAGITHHLRAAALFGIVGDHPSLQAALFNLAICRRATLASEGRRPDETVLDLVELCRKVCSAFGVGRDSAQGETAAAGWAYEMGDLTRARSYLEEAERLLENIESTYDQALFLETRAKIELAAPDGASDPARDLRAADVLFAQAGDDASSQRARRALEALVRKGPGRRKPGCESL